MHTIILRARRVAAGALSGVVAACLLASFAAAQQHLYCTDAKGAGLFWDTEPDGTGRVSELAPETFTVNIVSPERRLINKQVGGVRETVCRSPTWPEGNRGIVSCTDVSGAETWLFNGDRVFTRAYLFGTPLATDYTDPNIFVAHGTCKPY